jgi:putative nucleotidyltransferase with HDIG domain
MLRGLLDELDPFFDNIGDVESYLMDEHNWISQEVCVKMFERIRVHSGNPEIARSIGRESVIYKRFGYVENIYIKALGNPRHTLKLTPYINSKFNKTKSIELVELDNNHAVVRLKWFKDLGTTKDICLYNMGVYETLPTIWGLPMSKMEERKCFFHGDEYCEFAFEWVEKSFFDFILGFFSRRQEILKDSITEIEREKAHLARKYLEIENLNKELSNRIERLTSLDACSKATASILETDKLLDVVMSLIVTVMQFDRAFLMLVDNDRRDLTFVMGVGGKEDDLDRVKGYRVPIDRTTNILARVVDSGIAQVVTDVDKSFLRKENVILKKFNPKSFIAVPLITRNKVIGVLAAERFKGLKDFTSNDLDFVMNFCNQIAVSLENVRLIDSMKQSFVSSILSLATALETKDSYTRGHSNRVATYSTILARRLGLSEDTIEQIRLMALMHDIGKIGVPDYIINKAEKLSEDEFSLIKNHPVNGVHIIEPLLENNSTLRLVRSHHERFDGKGYPDGLSGLKIPLEARIMCLADSFDAMTSDRPYRKAMSREKALEEIRKNIGTQFCTEISNEFIDMISSMPPDLYSLISNGRNQHSEITKEKD